MARRTTPPAAENHPEHVVDIDVTAEMEESFLEYAYSVIYARALPDARDGLKPVQRRILYMMTDMGLRPERPFVKSARVVGEVMGKLHPHGDSAIYDAMVRLAQDFSLRIPLIDGHGNFGSPDDGPAAPRYTEVRMDRASEALTANLKEDVVDFVPNYDGSLMQPEVLPAAFPNLLVNGTSGIAVGMATNMAPHNLREVIRAVVHLIRKPEASLEEILTLIPGPDLPTGGKIVGLQGIRDAYATGRGTFKTRATVEVEQLSARRTGLVVTELPYLVGPEKVIDKIKDAVNSKKLQGISAVQDLTDRKHGLRLVIELKNGFNPQAVLAQLYRYTPMEDSFGINNVALVGGRPQTMGLLELLRVYIEHRFSVVRRRTLFRLGEKKERLHLVDGLLIAILDIDEVIQIIRSSDDGAAARTRLMAIYDLSERQANYILDLALRRLTKFSRIELENERDELRQAIAELEGILSSEQTLADVICAELEQVAEEFGTDRRTILLESGSSPQLQGAGVLEGKSKKAELALEIPDSPCWVIVSTSGQMARTADASPIQEGAQRVKHDAFSSVVRTSARASLGALTSRGRMIRINAVDLPVLTPSAGIPPLAGGVNAKDFLTLAPGEQLVSVLPLDAVLALGTAAGIVKRVNPEYPANAEEWEVITLKPGDQVIGAEVSKPEDHLVFITRNAQLLHFPSDAVRPQGRSAGGMAGIKLGAEDTALFFATIDPNDPQAQVVTVALSTDTLPGISPYSVKVSLFSEFPAKGRATGGVRAHRFLKGENALGVAWAGHGPARAVSEAGVARALPTEYAKRDGSGVPTAQNIAAIGPAIDFE